MAYLEQLTSACTSATAPAPSATSTWRQAVRPKFRSPTWPAGVSGLSSAGNFVLAQDYSGAWATHYVLNSSGVITDQGGVDTTYSSEYAWDPVTSRVYFFRDGTSPNDLHYEVINQATGGSPAPGETPYHGVVRHPAAGPRLRRTASTSCSAAAISTPRHVLNWSGSLGAPVADARWFANGSLVTLTTPNNQTLLRRLSEHQPRDARAVVVHGPGAARRGHRYERCRCVVINDGTVQFHSYVPDDDSDDDGVTNTQDAFPLDRRGLGRHRSRRLSRCLEPRQEPGRQHHGPDPGCLPAGLGMLAGSAWQRRRLQLRRDHSELHPGPGGAAWRRHLSAEHRQPARVSLVDQHAARTSIRTSWGSTRASAPWRRPRWRTRPATSACISDMAPGRSATST